jgi:hypothetical protein
MLQKLTVKIILDTFHERREVEFDIRTSLPSCWMVSLAHYQKANKQDHIPSAARSLPLFHISTGL